MTGTDAATTAGPGPRRPDGPTGQAGAVPADGPAEAVRRQWAGYAEADDRPLAGYATLLGVYGSMAGALGAMVYRRGAVPERIGLSDLALLSVATHKLARIIAKDSVTSVVRAPFTRYEAPGGPGEVNESVRGRGVRKAAGELLSCPFCLSVWAATLLTAGLCLAPRYTRLVLSVLTAVSASDALQFGYAGLERATDHR